MDFHIPKIWQILKHFSNKKISFLKSGYWIVVLLILDLTKKMNKLCERDRKKEETCGIQMCIALQIYLCR